MTIMTVEEFARKMDEQQKKEKAARQKEAIGLAPKEAPQSIKVLTKEEFEAVITTQAGIIKLFDTRLETSTLTEFAILDKAGVEKQKDLLKYLIEKYNMVFDEDLDDDLVDYIKSSSATAILIEAKEKAAECPKK